MVEARVNLVLGRYPLILDYLLLLLNNDYHQLFYHQLLAHVEGISFLEEPATFFSNRWLSCILIDSEKCGVTREELRLALEKENIESRPLWKPMHLQGLFSHQEYYGNGLDEELFQNGLCLPSGSNLTLEEKEWISSQLKVVFSR